MANSGGSWVFLDGGHKKNKTIYCESDYVEKRNKLFYDLMARTFRICLVS